MLIRSKAQVSGAYCRSQVYILYLCTYLLHSFSLRLSIYSLFIIEWNRDISSPSDITQSERLNDYSSPFTFFASASIRLVCFDESASLSSSHSLRYQPHVYQFYRFMSVHSTILRIAPLITCRSSRFVIARYCW